MDGKVVEGPPDAHVDFDHAHPQDTSLLFSLPAELRLRIYEYVFGSGIIHVTQRDCKPWENWSPDLTHDVEMQEDDDDELAEPNTILVKKYMKMTYALCRKDDWSHVYDLSTKAATLPSNWSSKPECSVHSLPKDQVIHRWHARHFGCLKPCYELATQDYTLICCDSQVDKLHFSCEACQQKAKQYREIFGPPSEGGLLRRHADSKLDLSILLVCRQIYRETRSLPYSLHTFDLSSTTTASRFANFVLAKRQIYAIRNVHLDEIRDGVGSLLELVETFPNLKVISLSMGEGGLQTGVDDAWVKYFGSHSLQKAEIVWGHDQFNADLTNRLKQRRATELLERWLTSRSLNEAIEHTVEYSRAKQAAFASGNDSEYFPLQEGEQDFEDER